MQITYLDVEGLGGGGGGVGRASFYIFKLKIFRISLHTHTCA